MRTPPSDSQRHLHPAVAADHHADVAVGHPVDPVVSRHDDRPADVPPPGPPQLRQPGADIGLDPVIPVVETERPVPGGGQELDPSGRGQRIVRLTAEGTRGQVDAGLDQLLRTRPPPAAVGVEHPADVGMPGAEEVHDGIGIPQADRPRPGRRWPSRHRSGASAGARSPGRPVTDSSCPSVGVRLPRRADQVPEDRPRLDAGQLVRVAHQHQPRPRAATRRAAGPSVGATPSRSRR